MTLRLLDLFSGIGGFSLGLERSGGFRTVAFCEIEPFPRRVLAKHWPKVPCYEDVRTLTAARLHGDGIGVDAICGGFPCQDISLAGLGAGLAGERSGLWSEYARLVGELRPRVVFVENVAALLGRGLDVVLGALATLGYDAEWHCIPASAVGAPHQRDRIWVTAHTRSQQHQGYCPPFQGAITAKLPCSTLADADFEPLRQGRPDHAAQRARRRNPDRGCERPHELAHASLARLPAPEQTILCGARWRVEGRAVAERSGWASEPDVGRVAHGVPARVDRLKGLGNAVVPQIPELLGRAYLASVRRAA